MPSEAEVAPRLRALIVDDEPLVAVAVADMLDTIGCQVVHIASTKAEALAIIASDDPGEIAFIDIKLDVPMVVSALPQPRSLRHASAQGSFGPVERSRFIRES